MDGQIDKNRQTIAVTLRLHFAARVNDIKQYYKHPMFMSPMQDLFQDFAQESVTT